MRVGGSNTPRLAVFVVAFLVLASTSTRASPPLAPAVSPVPVPDFRYRIEGFRVGRERVSHSEIVYRQGTFYQFYSDARGEVVVVETAPRLRLTLIDLKRKVQCQVLGVELDVHMADLRKRLARAIETRKHSNERAERVAAEMTRDLLDPRFQERFEPGSRKLHLENPVLTIDATGEAESDPARLVLIEKLLAALTEFASLRAPEDLPPFGLIETVQRLGRERRLRPREIKVVLRVAGPPQLFRWEHALVPQLTDREREAIRRVDGLRATATLIPFRAYEELN
jgi:hypothetical protein